MATTWNRIFGGMILLASEDFGDSQRAAKMRVMLGNRNRQIANILVFSQNTQFYIFCLISLKVLFLHSGRFSFIAVLSAFFCLICYLKFFIDQTWKGSMLTGINVLIKLHRFLFSRRLIDDCEDAKEESFHFLWLTLSLSLANTFTFSGSHFHSHSLSLNWFLFWQAFCLLGLPPGSRLLVALFNLSRQTND